MPIDRPSDPDTWINAVYQDAAIITQVDDGTNPGQRHVDLGFTCSDAQ